MKHFVYAFYSPSYSMVKIGKSSRIEQRWKNFLHWHFDENKSFVLYCKTKLSQKRIEDTLKVFFKAYPSIEAQSTNKDGYTECFDLHIIEEVRDFFQYFSSRYSHEYSYIENIKPFLHVHSFNMKDENLVGSIFPSINKNNLCSVEDEDMADF